jgi:hypothetical protein
VSPKREVSLVKGEHEFVFRYPAGTEADLIQSFTELAEDSDCPFDWFDAAVLSVQLGRNIEMEFAQIPATP